MHSLLHVCLLDVNKFCSIKCEELMLYIGSEDEQEDVSVYKEPPMYDQLLKTLGLASGTKANTYKKR